MTHIIPILTSDSGLCLTSQNWQDVGVELASFELSALLMKPGLSVLTSLSSLADYAAWPKSIVLNASMLHFDEAGGFTLRSHYDGARQRLDIDVIMQLIQQLKPQLVLLPKGFRGSVDSWPTDIMLFFPPDEVPINFNVRPYGVYFVYDEKTTSADELLAHVAKYKGLPCYVCGSLSLDALHALREAGVLYLESDRMTKDACEGLVYSHEGDFFLTDKRYAFQFEVIDKSCGCPTCKQSLTRAYLHYLFESTPLLCQRFLIQHNQAFTRA
jgi:queuine tRNA-ribosyltransferase